MCGLYTSRVPATQIYAFPMLCRSEVGKLAGERAAVLKKLVEVEMDGKAAGEQLIKLRDTIRKLKEVH